MKQIVYLYGFTEEEVEEFTTVYPLDGTAPFQLPFESIELKIAPELSPEHAAPYLVIHKRAKDLWSEDLEEESGGYHFILDTYNLDTVPPSIPSLSFLDRIIACPHCAVLITMYKDEVRKNALVFPLPVKHGDGDHES